MQIEKNIQERRENMVKLMSQNEEFIIIGLTGRTGSGCTDAAKIFSFSFRELELPWFQSGTSGIKNDNERDLRIIQRYASAHWLKFDIIGSKSIISTFIIDDYDSFERNVFPSGIETQKEQRINQFLFNNVKSAINKKYEKLKLKPFKMKDDDKKSLDDFLQNKEKACIESCQKAFDTIAPYYGSVDSGESLEERSRYISAIEDLLSDISVIASKCFIDKCSENDFLNKLKNINYSLDYPEETILKKNISSPSEEISTEDDKGKQLIQEDFNIIKYIFVHDLMPEVGNQIYNLLIDEKKSYTKLFQKFGNSIRKHGKIDYNNDTLQESNEVDIFAIPKKIVQFIKILRHPFSNNIKRPVRIVIDSIKSVFEARYLRQRYSSFYLFAISSSEEVRREKLLSDTKKMLTQLDLNNIDYNEYFSEGDKQYKKKEEFYNLVNNKDDFYYDPVRKYAYENNLQQFYLQDVAASIEDADVFISNNHRDRVTKNMELRWAIVRNVCLIMFPGLVPPSSVERCMQIAFSAKGNSGCLSRQVGAVVTDKEYNILSIGWNEVPCGDVSCARKNLVDLCKWEDCQAYTNFELENPDFRKKIARFNYNSNLPISRILRGLPMRYCFKDIHSDKKNPMRSRAMHAEEKALAKCGDNCEGGYLFTTSSPCEMCSKNAKNHKIKKIYYVELYPGISEAQYSDSGDTTNRAQHILFDGAVGRAYMQMYTPIMPQKDILDALGINSICWSKSE